MPRSHKEAAEAVIEAIEIEKQIRNLFTHQKFAVLSTQEEDNPYLNLVAFAETPDLQTILFATTRATRKFGNLSHKSGVALLVDNRSNDVADLREAVAVTVIGVASEVADSAARGELERVYLEKHPHMKGFVCSPSTALVKVNVESYVLVTQFQNVSILDLKSDLG
jgi:heme iron utilization protein